MTVALDVLPFLYSITLGMIIVNWGITTFRGHNRELLTISASMMCAGIAAMATVDQNTPAKAIGLSFLGGLGTGGILQPAATILTIVSPDEAIATITAATVSIRLVGASIGYAIYFNVLQNKVASVLPLNVATAAANAGVAPDKIPQFMSAFLGGNTTALAGYSLTVIEAATDAVKSSYVEGFRLVYFVSIAFGGSAVIACLFLGDIRRFMVDRVAVDIH
jgi:Fungal trichothecene efflux pump (TRI12)